MNQPRPRTVVAIVIAMMAIVAVTCVAIVTTSTNSHDEHDGSDDHAHLDPLDPDHASVETVAVNAVTIAHTWRPAQDNSTWQALHNASALLTDPIHQAAATAPSPPPRPLPEWAGWSRDRDQVSAAAAALEPATITDDTAAVRVGLTQTVLHVGGQTTPWSSQVLLVSLRRGESGWRVANYQVQLR